MPQVSVNDVVCQVNDGIHILKNHIMRLTEENAMLKKKVDELEKEKSE